VPAWCTESKDADMSYRMYYWLFYEHPDLCSLWEQGLATLAEIWRLVGQQRGRPGADPGESEQGS